MKKNYFSLIEIMIVISIIALVAAIAIPNLLGQSDEAKVSVAEIQIKSLGDTVTNYKMRTGRLPESLQDLVTDPGDAKKWKQLLEKLPQDPWNNAYQYEVAPDSFRGFEMISLGADGQAGGEGVNADITLSLKDDE